MKKVKDYRNLAYQVAQQLNSDNYRYYQEVDRYLVVSSMNHDEVVLNEQIYQLACDLFEAQKNGESAESFFGQSPPELAGALVQQTTRRSWVQRLILAMELTGVATLVRLSTDFDIQSIVTINLLEYVGMLVGNFLLIMLVLYFVKQLPILNNTLMKVGAILFMVVALLVGIQLSEKFTLLIGNRGMFTLGYPVDLVVIGVLILAINLALFYRRVASPSFMLSIMLVIACGMFFKRCLVHFSSLTDSRINQMTSITVLVSAVLVLGWQWYRAKKAGYA